MGALAIQFNFGLQHLSDFGTNLSIIIIVRPSRDCVGKKFSFSVDEKNEVEGADNAFGLNASSWPEANDNICHSFMPVNAQNKQTDSISSNATQHTAITL